MRILFFSILFLFSSLDDIKAWANAKDKREADRKQIIINVGESHAKGYRKYLTYTMENTEYTAKELNFELAELALQRGKDCEVIAMLEANAPIDDIQEVPAMAIRAGFKDIHAYAYWPATGKMAEILFGPVRPYSGHPSTN